MKIAIPILLLGIVIGYFIPRHTPNTSTPAQETNPSVNAQTRTASRSTSPRTNSQTNTLASIEELNELYTNDQTKKIATLTPDQIHQHIQALLSQSNPITGLSSKHKKLLKQFLSRLAKEDFLAASAWVESSLPPSTHPDLKALLLEALSQQDFFAALPHLKNLPPGKESDKLLGTLFFKSFAHGNDTALKLLTLLPQGGSGSSGTSVKFPEDFDFQTFADQTLALNNGNSSNRLSRYPTNLLEEWVARDPDAAISFYNEHLLSGKKRLPFNDLEELAEGYLDSAPKEKSTAWIKELLTEGTLEKNHRTDILKTILNRDSGQYLAQTLIQSQPTSTDQAALSAEFLYTLRGSSGSSFDARRQQILSFFPTPESRITHLIDNAQKYRHHKDTLIKNLQELGHPQQELDRFRQAAQK